MNVQAARQQMVDQQIRAWYVLDPRVLDAMGKVARERYVPAAFARLAYADSPIPLGNGHSMLAPSVDGRILQALGLSAGESVLEIGTGSGFLSACLSALGATVRSVEIDDARRSAAARLRADGRTSGPSKRPMRPGFCPHPPMTRSCFAPPCRARQPLLPMAAPGRAAVCGHRQPGTDGSDTGHAGRWREFRRDSLFETVIEPLVNATAPSKFRF